ncbi:hypothetical protein PIB30_092856 [Stylosanthes scabra]|uniref:Uncharacterized protein n=1 Tax=Stylosanthes scabra TaxID=79078 RepID=A0ABU6XUB5_9FABA|nr:hypothetical protein [Stylosanthes scabra]
MIHLCCVDELLQRRIAYDYLVYQVILQNVVHVSTIFINLDFKEMVDFMNNYRVKVLIGDETSLSLFVLLDAVVTKLLGKTCSNAFLVPETKTQDIIVGPVFIPIFPNYVPYARVQDYKNQVPTHIPIQLDAVKDLLDNVISVKVLSAASRNV